MYSGTKGDSKGGSGFNQITPEQTENMKGQQSASGAHGGCKVKHLVYLVIKEKKIIGLLQP